MIDGANRIVKPEMILSVFLSSFSFCFHSMWSLFLFNSWIFIPSQLLLSESLWHYNNQRSLTLASNSNVHARAWVRHDRAKASSRTEKVSLTKPEPPYNRKIPGSCRKLEEKINKKSRGLEIKTSINCYWHEIIEKKKKKKRKRSLIVKVF